MILDNTELRVVSSKISILALQYLYDSIHLPFLRRLQTEAHPAKSDLGALFDAMSYLSDPQFSVIFLCQTGSDFPWLFHALGCLH